MSNDDDFNLYDDLDDAFIQPLEKDIEKQRNDEKAKLAEKNENEESLRQKENRIAELEKEIERLNEIFARAERNFSLLCSTAKSEIER
jgi:ferritin-like metal-binding protein YciE